MHNKESALRPGCLIVFPGFTPRKLGQRMSDHPSIFIRDIFIWNNDNNSSHNSANKTPPGVSVPTNYRGGISQWPDRVDRVTHNMSLA